MLAIARPKEPVSNPARNLYTPAMRIADEKEIRFKLRRGLQKLPRSILRELASSPDKQEQALRQAVAVMREQFPGWEFHAPDPIEGHGQKNQSVRGL